MKKSLTYSLAIMFVLFLTACSAKQDVTYLYKKETPIDVEIFTPETLSGTKMGTIRATVTQDGKPVENPDYVLFEIWKQDGTVRYEMEEAKNEGNGTYSLSKNFKNPGLYFIKVHTSNNGSIIMPKKAIYRWSTYRK